MRKAIDNLIAQTAALDCSKEEVQSAVEAVLAMVALASKDELDTGLKRLSDAILIVPLAGSAILAYCVGEIVEAGGEATLPIDAVFDRFVEAMTLAQFFVESCEDAAVEDGFDPDLNTELVDRYASDMKATIPENSRAYESLELFVHGAFAILVKLPTLKDQLRKRHPAIDSMIADLVAYHFSFGCLIDFFDIESETLDSLEDE